MTNHNVRNLVLTLVMGFITTTVLIKFGFINGHWYLWLMVFALLSYPWSVPSGNIYSLWGGSGDADVYSLFGVYQNAGKDAFSLLGFLLYQRASEFAGQGIGVVVCQRSEQTLSQVIGIAVYQKARYDAVQFMGLIGYQDCGELSEQMLGISIYRQSESQPVPTCDWVFLNFAFLFKALLKQHRPA